MSFINAVLGNLIDHCIYNGITLATIVAMFIVVTLLSAYEFVVYRFILHRALYNKAFNICIAIIPYFISSIILTLQSNIIITLGTIGALAIIRFRTAVKDPVDMIFILWSIYTGITCGCQLYKVSIVTTILVSLVLIILNFVSFGMKTHILVLHMKQLNAQNDVEKIIKDNTKKYRIKSRNITDKGINFVFELDAKNGGVGKLTESLTKVELVDRFSLMEYEPDDIL